MAYGSTYIGHVRTYRYVVQLYSEIHPYDVSRQSNMNENIFVRRRYVFLHFLPFLLAVSSCFCSFSFHATWPLRRTRRQVLLSISQRGVGSIPDRRTEITERTEANVRRPFSGLAWGGWRETRRNGCDVSQFPQSTRYERFPRQISLMERVPFMS